MLALYDVRVQKPRPPSWGAASQKKVGLKWLEDKLMAQRSFEESSRTRAGESVAEAQMMLRWYLETS